MMLPAPCEKNNVALERFSYFIDKIAGASSKKFVPECLCAAAT